jgi:hypothetical protein
MDVPFSIRTAAVCAVVILGAVLSTAAGADSLPPVTVESQRDHEKLKHDVNVFVSSAILAPVNYGDTLWRWNDKICPLVTGVIKQQGEFVLGRISQIAKEVGAPLGPDKCKPNLYVIVAPDPEALLIKWWRQSPDLFAGETGADVKRFLVTPRPVRVWYSAKTVGDDGSFVVGLLDATSVRAKPFNNETAENVQPSYKGSRLTTLATRDISSVIVVVDAAKMVGINFGQLADYIGFVGLAQINLDKPLGDAPTILTLFKDSPATPPVEMTVWDKALLHGLYITQQKNRMQISEIETVALNDIAAQSAH